MFYRVSELSANSVDPDQMPHSATSDLSTLYAIVPLLDARLIRVNINPCPAERGYTLPLQPV